MCINMISITLFICILIFDITISEMPNQLNHTREHRFKNFLRRSTRSVEENGARFFNTVSEECPGDELGIRALCKHSISCEGACGFRGDEAEMSLFRLCSCDRMCLLYGDCCADFFEKCPVQSNLSRGLDALKADVECVDGYMIIQRCTHAHTSISFEDYVVSDKVLESLPVTDLLSGITYKNRKTYICSMLKQTKPDKKSSLHKNKSDLRYWQRKKGKSRFNFTKENIWAFLNGNPSVPFLQALVVVPPPDVAARYVSVSKKPRNSPGAELGPYAFNMLWHFFRQKVRLQSWLEKKSGWTYVTPPHFVQGVPKHLFF